MRGQTHMHVRTYIHTHTHTQQRSETPSATPVSVCPLGTGVRVCKHSHLFPALPGYTEIRTHRHSLHEKWSPLRST